MTTAELQSRLVSWDNKRGKVTVKRSSMKVVDVNGRIYLGNSGDDTNENLCGITRWALGQLCNSLTIPASYINRCPAHLACTNINYWVPKRSGNAKLCLLDSTDVEHVVIGIVSDHYVEYSNRSFYSDIASTLDDLSIRYELDHAQITPECFDGTIRIPSFSVESSYAAPDSSSSDTRKTIEMGLHFRNSEVGYSSALVTTCIVDRFKNYTIPLVSNSSVKTGARMIHVGRSSDKFAEDIAVLIGILGDNYSNILGKFEKSGKYTITIANVKDLVAEYKLNKNVLDDRLGYELFEADDDSRVRLLDVIEGIATVASQKKYPARWDMELIAGSVLQRFEDRFDSLMD